MKPVRRSVRESLPIALIRAREAVIARFRPLLAAQGYTEQQWRVMRILEEFGAMEANQLAKETAILMPSLTRIIATLERNGIISRERKAFDKRRAEISLTVKGMSELDAGSDGSNLAYAELETEFGNEKIVQLIGLLNELADKHPQNQEPKG